MDFSAIPFDSFDRLSGAFFLRFFLNCLSIAILLRFIYYPAARNKDYLFTLALFNIVIFIITYLLNRIEISLGFAFGLFAVFTMLRYRTQTINSKDMTFLVICIGIALLHAVSPASIFELLVLNTLIIGSTYFLNSNLLIKNEFRKTIIYEKIDMIVPEKRRELVEDLRKRTGLNIHRITIGRVDFMRDTARIRVFYYLDNEKESGWK